MTASVYAQHSHADAVDSVRSVFSGAINRKAFTDTNRVIFFSLKVAVKLGNNRVKISSIEVSDSIAYKIFESFKFLSRINYKVFMGKQKSATFVFPVAIFLSYPGKKETGLVSIKAVSGQLINYMFLKDGKDQLSPTYDYIYIPGLHIETSTLEDY